MLRHVLHVAALIVASTIATNPSRTDAQTAPVPAAACEVSARLEKRLTDVAATIARQAAQQEAPDLGEFPDLLPSMLDEVNAKRPAPVLDPSVGVLPKLRARAETARNDKQVGASARSGGATGATEKTGFARLLALAVENGSLQQQQDGTQLTVSSSPYALLAGFGGDTDEQYARYGMLNRIGLAATFRTTAASVVDVSGDQLAEWSARIRLTGDHSSRARGVQQELMDILGPALQRRGDFTSGGVQALFGSPGPARLAYHAAIARIDQDLSDVTRTGSDAKAIASVLACSLRREAVELLPVLDSRQLEVVAGYGEGLAQAEGQLSMALAKAEEHLDQVAARPALTFAYAQVRPAGAGHYSDLKLLFERGGPVRLVANAGASLYHDPDPAKHQETLRDLNFATSLEIDLGRGAFLANSNANNRSSLALIGRYERFLENRFFSGRKADIGQVQLKLELPLHGAVTLPVSVSWASATELIKESHVRAHIGFTIDTDKLFALKQAH